MRDLWRDLLVAVAVTAAVAVFIAGCAPDAHALCDQPPIPALATCPAVATVHAGDDLAVACSVTNPNPEPCTYQLYFTPDVSRSLGMYGETDTGDPNSPATVTVPPYMTVTAHCELGTSPTTPAGTYRMSFDVFTAERDVAAVGTVRVVRP